MKKFSIAALVLAAALFAYGLFRLFEDRFAVGDIYPEYSSLRSDPLGTKAFYESLDRLINAARNYRPLPKLGDGRNTTLFILGVDPFALEMTEAEYQELEQFAGSGGRIVISLYPRYLKSAKNAPAPPGQTLRKQKEKGSEAKSGPFDRMRSIPLSERWGMNWETTALPRTEAGPYQAQEAQREIAAAEMPESISCHTAVYFTELSDVWRVVYARPRERPVIIERRFGDGTIVLSADSYWFSNEAMLQERYPALLAWMVGPSRAALFDETHLGVTEQPGVAALARKYRLHGLFAALMLLAGLFVWKSSVSFLPPHAEEASRERGETIAGKESAAGFVNLLRRNLPNREILATCLAEWKKTCAREVPRRKLQEMQEIIDAENQRPAKDRAPVRTYQAIARILARKV